MSDLGSGEFLKIVTWVAQKQGNTVYQIGRYKATSQICSTCGKKQKLDLWKRVYDCPHCDLILDRDHNATINIQRTGGINAHC